VAASSSISGVAASRTASPPLMRAPHLSTSLWGPNQPDSVTGLDKIRQERGGAAFATTKFKVAGCLKNVPDRVKTLVLVGAALMKQSTS
jgi:hypothetical protein